MQKLVRLRWLLPSASITFGKYTLRTETEGEDSRLFLLNREKEFCFWNATFAKHNVALEIQRNWQPFLPALWMYRFGYFLKIANGMIVYFLLVAISYGITFYKSSIKKKIRAKRLGYQLEEGRLQEFKMNLMPGVLLRMLDSVSDWIDRDPDAAEELVAGIGEYLRRHLRTLQKKVVSVQEELELLHSFREIAVPGTKRDIHIEVSLCREAGAAEIPGFLVQGPVEWILENMHANEACRIKVRGEKSGDTLHLKVHCCGKGLTPLPEAVVSALEKRLGAAYEGRYELQTRFLSDETYGIEMAVPYHPYEEQVVAVPVCYRILRQVGTGNSQIPARNLYRCVPATYGPGAVWHGLLCSYSSSRAGLRIWSSHEGRSD
jgi:hypothetical protein